MVLLLTWKILGLLVNTLAPDDRYHVLNWGNLTQPIQMHLSQKQKTFPQFLHPFFKCRLNLEPFEKRWRHRFCTSTITDSENAVRLISKKSRFRGSFEEQDGKRVQTLLKSASQHLYDIYWSLWKILSCKKSLLVICEILWLFANIFAATERCPVFKRDKLTIPIQMQLYHKEKTFFQFLVPFSKSALNLEHFEKKDDPQRFWTSEIVESQKLLK